MVEFRTALLAGAALCVIGGGPAAAQVAQDGGGGPDSVSLTIYNQNIALVEDVRALDLPAGRARREFPGVSAGIRPETVSLSGRGLSVVEQNFDYDLLTPDKLMQSAVGEQIGIVRTNPGSGAQETQRATVLAANQGVVLEVDGRIECCATTACRRASSSTKCPRTCGRGPPSASPSTPRGRGGAT